MIRQIIDSVKKQIIVIQDHNIFTVTVNLHVIYVIIEIFNL